MTDDSINAGRRRFLVGSTSVVGAAGVVGAAVPFVGSWSPSAKARAAGENRHKSPAGRRDLGSHSSLARAADICR